jgi:putative Holliday junction resolvase
MSRILAVDYGMKRCGLAVTDPMRIIVTPLAAVSTKELRDFLLKYFTSEKVQECVVGMPYTSDDSETPLIVEILIFIEWLQKQFPDLIVSQIDEFGTSAEASRALIHAGLSRKKRREKTNIDMMSAVIILKKHLQEYL